MPGFNRSQTFWIWGFLLVIALILISLDMDRGQTWNLPGRIIVEITAPLQEFIKNSVKFTEKIWAKYFKGINSYNENIRLKKELTSLKMENSRYRELLATHQRLQQLLQFKDTIEQPLLAAQVIGRDPSGWFRSVIIDKGEKSGLKVNMPVVNAQGVVGRLVSVSANYAKVLLIIDQNSAVDCIIQRSRDTGILKGYTSKVCDLNYVLKTSDIVVGDVVVTSGLGGVFPKGVPVGLVIEVEDQDGEMFKNVSINPVVDFSKLEELLVILKENPLLNNLKDD